jgi:ferredoxin-NADP reductase
VRSPLESSGASTMGPAAPRRTLRVVETAAVADGVRLLRLADPRGDQLPAWEPGAHIDVVLPSGRVRQYSLCGSPQDLSRYEIAVLREPDGRGGSLEVHRDLPDGVDVTVVGPRNRFPLRDAEKYVFVAGGIGITPLLPMIEDVDRRGRPWRLVYGGRSRGTMAFLDRLARWPGAVTIQPQDEFGLLDLPTLLAPDDGTLVYCCGPEPLLQAVRSHCAERWPAGCLRFERFTAAEVTTVPSRSQAFEVQCGRDGPVLDVPADRSVLEVLLDAGADVLFSCEEGTCGSCETTVLAGRPDHRDELLTPEEREAGLMLVCVSRSLDQRLVLDVRSP